MLLLLCWGVFCVQVGYIAWLLTGVPTHPPDAALETASGAVADADMDSQPSGLPPVTVVVALRNERNRLPALAQALHRQTHPDLHIVWVNDHSTDGTADWLEAHAAPQTQEHVVHHTGTPGKKHALDAGIQAAPTELLAFTDADCTPPPTWLTIIARTHAATQHDTILIGPSVMPDPHGLLQRLAGYETWTANIAMLAAAQHGAAYMAVGRSLSYPASVYERAGGHHAHAHLLSGDDDLLVQAAREVGVPCRPLWNANAHVPTAAPTTWRRWLHGQRRHTSAARAYAIAPALHISAYYGSALLLYLTPLLVGSAGLGLLALRTIGVGHLMHRAGALLQQSAPTLLFPVWDAVHTALRIGISIAGVLAPPTRWG